MGHFCRQSTLPFAGLDFYHLEKFPEGNTLGREGDGREGRMSKAFCILRGKASRSTTGKGGTDRVRAGDCSFFMWSLRFLFVFCICFVFVWLHQEACGILVPRPGTETEPSDWQ